MGRDPVTPPKAYRNTPSKADRHSQIAIKERGHIAMKIGVNPKAPRADMRGCGIGTSVCLTAMDLLRQEGCDVAFLAVGAKSGTAAFYERLGFVLLGKAFTFVNAHRVTQAPSNDDVGMLAPVDSREVFDLVMARSVPLHIGDAEGFSTGCICPPSWLLPAFDDRLPPVFRTAAGGSALPDVHQSKGVVDGQQSALPLTKSRNRIIESRQDPTSYGEVCCAGVVVVVQTVTELAGRRLSPGWPSALRASRQRWWCGNQARRSRPVSWPRRWPIGTKP